MLEQEPVLRRMPCSRLQGILINFRCHRTGPESLRIGAAELGFEVEKQESMEKVVG